MFATGVHHLVDFIEKGGAPRARVLLSSFFIIQGRDAIHRAPELMRGKLIYSPMTISKV